MLNNAKVYRQKKGLFCNCGKQMIISHKFRFIFIKTFKTAGTSIEIYLSDHCSQDDVLTPIFPHVNPHRPRNFEGFFNHMAAHSVRERVGMDLWKNYFTFCVERNPWDKAVSHFYHLKKYGANTDLTFDEYLCQDDFAFNEPLYVCDSDPQKVIVNRVLRYESLSEDLNSVFKTLGVPFTAPLQVRAKGDVRLDRRPYPEFYTTRQRSLIEEKFSREIARHGYTFG